MVEQYHKRERKWGREGNGEGKRSTSTAKHNKHEFSTQVEIRKLFKVTAVIFVTFLRMLNLLIPLKKLDLLNCLSSPWRKSLQLGGIPSLNAGLACLSNPPTTKFWLRVKQNICES